MYSSLERATAVVMLLLLALAAWVLATNPPAL
jgi:hypothetical protein